jgi:hypothetical protein
MFLNHIGSPRSRRPAALSAYGSPVLSRTRLLLLELAAGGIELGEKRFLVELKQDLTLAQASLPRRPFLLASVQVLGLEHTLGAGGGVSFLRPWPAVGPSPRALRTHPAAQESEGDCEQGGAYEKPYHAPGQEPPDDPHEDDGDGELGPLADEVGP